jgi:prepilin-type N-terminal cleavage/methylation domain-containing protein
MSNTFTKFGFGRNSFRGFTLIELLVVIAIIGLLATIIAAPIQSARKKARDAKKIAELKSTELALEQYAESNQAQYPKTLAALSPQFMPLLSSFAASTTSTARDAFAYSYYEAQATGGASTTFAYHLGVKLEVYGPSLETDRDCVGATLSNALVSPFCAVYNGNTMYITLFNNGSQLVTGANATSGWPATFNVANPTSYGGSDFQSRWYSPTQAGAINNFTEESSSTCVSSNDCIFDTTSQQ